MSDAITLSEAVAIIDKEMEGTEIVPFSFNEITAKSKSNFDIGGSVFRLSDGAQKQFSELVSVPFPYVKRSPADLVALNYNFQIAETPQRSLNAVMRKGAISSFAETDIPHVGHEEVLTAAASEFGDDAVIKRFRLSESGQMGAVITSPELNFVDNDTPFYGGVKVKFSDTWAVHPVVEAYLEREWCTNGATSQIDNRKFRVRGYSRDAIVQQFAEFAGIAKKQVQPMFDGFIHLRDEKVGDVRSTVLRICQENKLPDKVFRRMMEYWGGEGFKATFPRPEALVNNPTMYHVVNLFTFVGTHCPDMAPEHKEMLIAIGGNSALNHHDRCGSCGTRV
tara:strand:+ start:545 stop:1552 length:1008 start_codon:yes stop_codon:yes gene_type:complete